jgi:hypothetical protein
MLIYPDPLKVYGRHLPFFNLQILEVELVSANGDFVVANAQGTRVRSRDGSRVNETNNSDLFWALRGGGGSTW